MCKNTVKALLSPPPRRAYSIFGTPEGSLETQIGTNQAFLYSKNTKAFLWLLQIFIIKEKMAIFDFIKFHLLQVAENGPKSIHELEIISHIQYGARVFNFSHDFSEKNWKQILQVFWSHANKHAGDIQCLSKTILL